MLKTYKYIKMSDNPKLKKIKNKKKDVITINPLEVLNANSLKNNFKDKSKEEIKKEKKLIQENKINSQPLSSNQVHTTKDLKSSSNNSKYYLLSDKNNSFLMDKIIVKLEYFLSYNEKIDERLYKLLAPLLSVKHYNYILEERECLNICGNLLCNNKIKNKVEKGTFSYDNIRDKFGTENIGNYFCCKNCFAIFQKALKYSNKNYKYDDLFNLDTVLLFEALQDYYEKDDELTRISNLAANLLETFIRNNRSIEKEIKEYCKKKRVELTKIFVEDFDEILKQKGIYI